MAPTAVSTPNYSLFSIPAYLFIAMIPHVYSSSLLSNVKTTNKSGSPSKTKAGGSNIYNLANPRSSENSATYKSALDRSTFARWERARGAHANMSDNAAFFVSAILAGVMTKLDAGYMNRMAGWYLASRLAYLFVYISIEKAPLAFARTVFFFAGKGLLVSLWWEAGKKIMAGEY